MTNADNLEEAIDRFRAAVLADPKAGFALVVTGIESGKLCVDIDSHFDGRDHAITALAMLTELEELLAAASADPKQQEKLRRVKAAREALDLSKPLRLFDA